MAKIKYNGEIIAEIKAGQSITLYTDGHELDGDLVIEGFNDASIVPEWDGSVSKIVSFTFSGEVHYFEEGMTWGAWLATGYNDGNFEARGDYVAPKYAPTDYYVADADKKRVKVTDEISSKAAYILTNQPTE